MIQFIHTVSKKLLNSEFIRFLVAGAANTVVGYFIYYLLLEFISYLAAYSIMYVFGIILSYLLNSIFVFQSEIKLSKFLKFPVVYLVQYIIGIISLAIIVELLKINKLVAVVGTIVISLPITFLLSKTIIKKS